MSPRSLVFSSDQETSRAVSQALNEIEFDVEHCSEIFSSLKRLTARAFDLIVVDCDEGLEAGFLLKTCREMHTGNAEAFAVVLSRGDARAIARESGANLVLVKPILPEQMQFALLGNAEFLRRMKAWLPPRNMHGKTVHVDEKGERPESAVARPAPWPAVKTLAPSPKPSPQESISPRRISSPTPSAPRFNTLDSSADDGIISRLKPSVAGMLQRIGPRESAFLRRAAMVVIFFTVGYVLSQPISAIGARVARAWDSKTPVVEAAQNPQAAPAEENISDEAPSSQSRRGSNHKIRVQAVRASDDNPSRSVRHDAPKGIEASAQLTPVEAASNAPSAAHPAIPDSLKAPSPDDPARRSGSSTLLSALEPVILPEYLSEKLLLDKVQPSYPEQAVRAGLQGPVVLQAWIGRDGKIMDLKLVRGSMLLGQAAFKAVRQWRYKPYVMNGEAVEAQTLVTVDFRLP